MRASFAVLSLLAVALAYATAEDVAGPVISTMLGQVRGVIDPLTQTSIFYGIPFAKPPVGELRFRPPLPAEAWEGVYDATTPAAKCLQLRIAGYVTTGQEDCLTLDVYVPPGTTANSSLPVMVWIHGGAFVFGGSSAYAGQHMAKNKNVVVVMIQYRLGVFGFLALPQLMEESGTTGAYGIQDQQLALKWTKNHIAAFGGNPNHVTIYGESAGAMSVCAHISMPSSAGLFVSAIMESGTCDTPEFFPSYEVATSFGLQYAADYGCTSDDAATLTSCLRAKGARKLMDTVVSWLVKKEWKGVTPPPKLWPLMPWGPTIDGTQLGLPLRPYAMIKSGRFNKVPVIMGTNKNEGSLFIPLMPLVLPGVKLPVNDQGVQIAAGYFFNSTIAAEVEARYPRNKWNPLSDTLRLSECLRDFFFTCATRRALRAMNNHGVATYTYEYGFADTATMNYLLGNYHGSEMKYVMGNLPADATADQKEMSALIQTYWSNHALYGSPNGDAAHPSTAPNWPTYDATDRSVLLTVPPAVKDLLHTENCDFWDTLDHQ